jgi:putative transposase
MTAPPPIPESVKNTLEALTLKRSKFSAETIESVLRRHKLGEPIQHLCFELDIAQATFYRWQKLYGGLNPMDIQHQRNLEEENKLLKKQVQELTMDKQMLQDIIEKKI